MRTAIAAALLLAGAVPAALAQTRPTESGPVQGFTAGTIAQFRGIPYAAPPIGALRWRPPALPAAWTGTRSAANYGPACPQLFNANTSEDCLSLNISVPLNATSTSKLPVMVWIHGGGFISGTGSDFDGAALANAGHVVVVTINYRLGYLGFLAHAALTAADSNHVSGNYGLLDQQAALAWVRRNIAGFGGNPGRLTIFGESAGGQSVVDQLISPGAGKLAGAIIQSGAYALTLPTLSAAETTTGAAAATKLGCPDQSAACLYALDATKIGAALNPLSDLGAVSAVVDGRTLLETPAVALNAGHFQRVPVINGSNHDEMRLFTGLTIGFGGAAKTADQVAAFITSGFGSDAPAFLAAYTPNAYPGQTYAPDYAYSALLTDQVFACSAHLFSALMAPYTPVYQYELNDPNAPTQSGPDIAGFSYGNAHSSDLSYLFLNYNVAFHPGPAVFSPSQKRLVSAMQGYWTSFARYGRPLASQSGAWPKLVQPGSAVLELRPPSAAASAGFFNDHHCDLLKSRILTGAALPDTAPY